MEYTKNLKLSKPSYDDDVDVQILNKNMDILDGKIGDLPFLPLTGGTMTGSIKVNATNILFTNGTSKYDALIRVGTNGNFDIGANYNRDTGWATTNLFLHSYNKPKWYNSITGGKDLVMDYGTSIGSHNGYTKFSNGVIIQWGFVSTTTQGAVHHVTFKTPMSNANYVTFVNKSNGTGTAPSYNNGEWWSATYNLTTTGFDVICDTASYGDKQMWLVIGG